ncbi:MAG: AAA family ATPase [Candidatus Heimdallarchaeota archaeon]
MHKFKQKFATIIENAEPFKQSLSKPLLTSFTAADLIKTKLPEPKWAIKGILSEGVNILGGKPKQGKSIFALNIGISITSGSKVLGSIDVESGAVLHLALEDTPRRLQSRLKAMLQTNEAPKNLFIETKWPKIDERGLETLNKRIKEIPNLRLVIIDTLKKIKSGKSGKSKTLYDIDYEFIASIKDIADENHVSILVIHHLRKSDAEDIMDTFSGTFGLTGAADGLLALNRMTGQSDATLSIIGRDVDAAEYALKYDPQLWSWILIGEASEVKASNERQAIYDFLKNSKVAVGPKEIRKATGIKYRTVTNGLKKLTEDGSIMKSGYGKYISSPLQEYMESM